MKEKATWSLIIASLVLLYLGWALKGFFQINYAIGTAGVILGLYNLYKEKK